MEEKGETRLITIIMALYFTFSTHNQNPEINFVYVSRFRWLIKAAMRPLGPFDSSPSVAQYNDCVLVVGVSRPKLAAIFLTIMIISLFLTFHVLYDSAIYSIQVIIIIIINSLILVTLVQLLFSFFVCCKHQHEQYVATHHLNVHKRKIYFHLTNITHAQYIHGISWKEGNTRLVT